MSNKHKDERELLSKPGDTISETLDHIKMSQAELAERMGKTPSKINDLISGKEPISVMTAFQLEKVLGIDAQFWLNREMLYREKLSRIEQEEALEDCIDWVKAQPITELKKCGYVKSTRVGPAMAEECLKFYGVATPIQWESLYVEQYVSAANYRKSEAHANRLSSMAAWLRIGEIEMRKLELKPYNKDLFKQSLSEIRNLVRNHPEDFASQLQQYCLNVGVAIVYTMCIPKAPISGVARWVGGNPLIQLTDRYKSNDQFWFTFFHEVGHILLHGKKDVFIEDFDEYIIDEQKENEANDFANKILLPEDITIELPEREKITERTLRDIARKYNTHAAIVLGRLQRLGILPYSFGASLKLKVVLDDVINKTGDL
jgi:HTH-type transcriptional regulator/antitoxin HigA